MQGECDEVADALGRADLDAASLPDNERVLLDFVGLLTRHAYRNTAADVQRVRDAGWTDEQVAEGVYITALFAFFNRVADAFGLEDPAYSSLAKQGKAIRPAEQPRPQEDTGDAS